MVSLDIRDHRNTKLNTTRLVARSITDHLTVN
jgi:hypothetical protein